MKTGGKGMMWEKTVLERFVSVLEKRRIWSGQGNRRGILHGTGRCLSGV
jgi:hypothetical protein